jgi:hypothetical protein
MGQRTSSLSVGGSSLRLEEYCFKNLPLTPDTRIPSLPDMAEEKHGELLGGRVRWTPPERLHLRHVPITFVVRTTCI